MAFMLNLELNLFLRPIGLFLQKIKKIWNLCDHEDLSFSLIILIDFLLTSCLFSRYHFCADLWLLLFNVTTGGELEMKNCSGMRLITVRNIFSVLLKFMSFQIFLKFWSSYLYFIMYMYSYFYLGLALTSHNFLQI